MKKYLIIIIVVIAAAALLAVLGRSERAVAPANMILTSPSFKDGETIPKKFTCEGGNINPELQIQNVPSEAKSLALILHDPDAPVTGGFTHWLVWNIDPKTSVIKEESVPPGLSAEASAKAGAVEGANGTGKTGYVGPCPPVGHGVHHYHFKLFALNRTLDLKEGSDKVSLEKEIGKYLVAKTELVGLYQR